MYLPHYNFWKCYFGLKTKQKNQEHLRVSIHFLELSFLKDKKIVTSIKLSEVTVKAYVILAA